MHDDRCIYLCVCVCACVFTYMCMYVCMYRPTDPSLQPTIPNPSHDPQAGGECVTFEAIAAVLGRAIQECFPDPNVRVIAEPGMLICMCVYVYILCKTSLPPATHHHQHPHDPDRPILRGARLHARHRHHQVRKKTATTHHLHICVLLLYDTCISYPPINRDTPNSRRAVYPNGAVAAAAADDSTLPERAAAGVVGMVIEESGAYVLNGKEG